MFGLSLNVLKDKNALIIFLSQIVSAICDKMMSIGLVWYLTKEFSVNIVPWFLSISFLPHLLMCFSAASFINRIGTYKTVILTEFFRGLVLLLLYLGIVIFDFQGSALLWGLFIASFFVGLGTSLFNPAILSLPPQVVTEEKIPGLNALIDTSLSLSTILGASFAVFILNLVDLKTLILINAVSFFWAGALQLKLQMKNEKNTEAIPQAEMSAPHPLKLLKENPAIARMLTSFLFLNLIFTPLLVMIPWYVLNVYAGNSSHLAMIEGAMGVGAFLTGVFLSLSSFQVPEEKRIKMISSISFLFGVSFLLFAISKASWQGAMVLFSVGVLTTFLNIQVLTYFQTALKENEVPAIMTAVNVISAASVPLSLGFSGLLFPHVSIPLFARGCGIIILLIALILPAYLRGSLWKLEAK